MKATLGLAAATIALLVAAPPARAQKRLAVLEFQGAEIKPQILEAMANEARSGALAALSPQRAAYLVMTRESMVALLKDMGKKACNEGECEVETARNIGADLVVTGEVLQVEGTFWVTMKLHESAKGALLATERAEGKGQLIVLRNIAPATESLVRKGLGLEKSPGSETAAAPTVTPTGGPSIKKSTVTDAVGDLTIAAKPKDQARLEITDPAGKTKTSASPYKNGTAAVGKWKVVAKAAGYADEAQEFSVAPDEVTAINLELKQLGGLKVTGTPTGAAVKVTGPAGFSDEGGLPWEGAGLRGGEYRVEVSRKGYAKLEQRVTVAAGKTETVKVDLKKESEAGGSCPTGMAAIPGGSFTPGERPVEVTVQPFCMDLTEVTVEAYSGCAKSGKCSARDISKKCNLNLKGGGKEQHPMNCVDWEQARAFCDAQGKRLPTDEEWEWAARGGEEAREFPWSAKATGEAPFGPQPGAQLCWNGDGNDLGKKRRKGTCQVGSYPASDNRWGVHDLAGNVWEWTASKSETDADQRGFRGGGWDTPEPARIRVAKRNWIKASYRENDLGFRCVKSR